MSKPTKNRIMCPECGRTKMLFETESKARNFIKFNGDDFGHENELRPYYCQSCGGYHISSKVHKKSYDTTTERLINAYRESKTTSPMIEVYRCFNILVSLNLQCRKKINEKLKTDIFSDFSDKVKEQAKIKYYKKYSV